jgi:ADP-heptose:LPS heptosyltransferase
MHLLVIRTSSMGDVALTTPVLTALRKKYPETEITLVTRPAFTPFFASIEDLNLFTPDFNKRHKGFTGLIRLPRDIKKQYKFEHIIDLHDVIRSKILRWMFRLYGIPASVINKGRAEKKQVIKGRIRMPLKHTVERYCDVFQKAGFPVIPEKAQPLKSSHGTVSKITGLPLTPDVINIGVAPYAKHELKIWPEENMIRLLTLISEQSETKYWLFGGKEEFDRLSSFHERVPESFVVSGNMSLREELDLMSNLDFMITMDSSNMHMAALSGTEVISIWGATDPMTGFGAWGQPDEYSIRIPAEELTCRPCTIYGKGKCRRGDFACMNWLTSEKVFESIMNLKLL